LEEDLNLREKAVQPSSIAAGFVKQVERQMNSTLGSRRVQRGGVDVITTLDADLQQQFQCTTATQLIRVQSSNISGVAPVQNDCDASLLLPTQSFLNESISGLTAGGLIMDPATGEVLAYQEPLTLDGKTLPDSGYEPGSLAHPFIAAASFAAVILRQACSGIFPVPHRQS
jgi:membrane peptidoglycan carboxypeptidase